MVQFKTLTTLVVASALILPSLAMPLDTQATNDLFARDYEDGLVERDITFTDLEARDPDPKFNFGKFLLGLFRRDLEEVDSLEARDPDPKFNFGKFLLGLFRRETDSLEARDPDPESDDLFSRDTFEDLD